MGLASQPGLGGPVDAEPLLGPPETLCHEHGQRLETFCMFDSAGKLATASGRARVTVAGVALAGLVMPLGILAEVYLALSPIFVLVGAFAMTVSVATAGGLSLSHWAPGVTSPARL